VFDAQAQGASIPGHEVSIVVSGKKHFRFSSGELFWAFAGCDVCYNGMLTVETSVSGNISWTFKGTLVIEDVYSFPDVDWHGVSRRNIPYPDGLVGFFRFPYDWAYHLQEDLATVPSRSLLKLRDCDAPRLRLG